MDCDTRSVTLCCRRLYALGCPLTPTFAEFAVRRLRGMRRSPAHRIAGVSATDASLRSHSPMGVIGQRAVPRLRMYLGASRWSPRNRFMRACCRVPKRLLVNIVSLPPYEE
ncbi:hypothetical protein EVAR_54756_1 [Eumeta japonica]|uniref:Uncharacterized protein n=1 Tax=Eumeta variegata TaxID=151549 RepID=A0A4C1YEI1_EUMVA|nr:hypothetical protein EVAR_54756_1 [Eumeta japonica]